MHEVDEYNIEPHRRTEQGEWLTVNLSMFELSGRNMILKQNINLAKGTIFGLRKPEPAPNVT